jgi:putative DNA methylase
LSSIPRECKRLAEVDFPIAEVSRHAAREKSIRHGHPSTLHLWWARRPLASSRAMLLALLLPDPCDPQCPPGFLDLARAALPRTLFVVGPTNDDLREALLKFIGAFANWDRSTDPVYLTAARNLVRAAHGVEPPLVVDPFAGGGSIPLESLRIGCETFASDLNPVACLILRVLLEEIPRDGPRLGAQLRKIGGAIKQQVERELSEFYPPDPDGARPIAYLWARTALCESPNCGAEIPLARSFWLSKTPGKRLALKPQLELSKGESPSISFEIITPETVQQEHLGTVSRAKATCIACGATLPPERVRNQLRASRGGCDVIFDVAGRRIGGATLLAVVTLNDKPGGRRYRLPIPADYHAVWRAGKAREVLRSSKLENGLWSIPDEPTPLGGGSGAGRAFSTRIYGMTSWGDLFTARQQVALAAIVTAVRSLPSSTPPAVRIALALVVDRCADRLSSLCSWTLTREGIRSTFGRPALPIVWDFCEAFPFSESSGSYDGALDWVTEVTEAWPGSPPGHTQLADAGSYPLPDASADVWFTDPPYYDAVPYADLSDFFFVWLKRTLPELSLMRDPFDSSNVLSPKRGEIVQDDGVSFDGVKKDRAFFEKGMARAFREGRRILRDDGVGTVVFAHKTTEGWEALLSGLIQGGWTITGSWPIATEMASRQRARDSAALATSIHLVCRPRSPDAPIGEWAEVARELPTRVGEWMLRLEREGVRGADLVFACIGPAMEVYSRYSKVVDAQDREIPLGGDPTAGEPHEKGFLAKVWEVVGRLALEQILGSVKDGPTSLEEDARLTALFLWTIQSSATEPGGDPPPSSGVEQVEDGENEEEPNSGGHGRFSLPHDVVRRFAQPLGIHLENWEGRIIRTEKGVVQLLPIEDRTVQLFGQENIVAASSGWEESIAQRGRQLSLFPDEIAVPVVKPAKQGAKRSKKVSLAAEGGVESESRRRTTLDRLHMAMLLQANGATAALKTFLEEEHRRGPDLERLANALAALYPRVSEERRLVEALTLIFPR